MLGREARQSQAGNENLEVTVEAADIGSQALLQEVLDERVPAPRRKW